jgi:hypothetical protein
MNPETNPATEPDVKFGAGDYIRTRSAWGFFTADGQVLLADGLVGKTVNIGTKDGMVYDSTIVTAFDEQDGTLTLFGGLAASDLDNIVPVDGRRTIWIYDIARGYTHKSASGPYDGPEGRARLTGSLDTGGSLTGDDDDDPDEANINEPPSPAADMLDSLISDSDYRDLSADLTFSGIHDTCPGGIGEAAVHVTDTLGHRYLLVAVPVEQMGALDNRSYVRRLLAEKQPQFAQVLAQVERLVDVQMAGQ